MMKESISVSCPLDCPDLCRFSAIVEEGRVIKLIPDRKHPVTKGFACKKGMALIQRQYHPDRLLYPLVRTKNGFEKTTYSKVIEKISQALFSIKETHGSSAILNYSGTGGYGGIKGQIQSMFFNCLGGATIPDGSLCWSAGIAAQNYDFGTSKGHDPDDLLEADTILVWGRNPKFTNVHLYALLKKAQKKGNRVIVIDPVRTATAKDFEYVRIEPSTDGALALGMANIIIENNLCNMPYVEKHVLGFERFKAYAAEFTQDRVEKITGIEAGTIKDMALAYARPDKACIYIGFGMQRYQSGGNSVRCIDALGAITGRIGKKGCGVNYAAKSFGPLLSSLEDKTRAHAKNQRGFIPGRLGEFIEKTFDPPIKAIFVHAANPLTQSPDLKKTITQFSKVGLKVVFDHFMTDTAKHADIVIPAAFSFEQEDLFATGMYSPVLNHSKKAVDPPNGIIPEFEFYLKLAQKMGIENLGFKDSNEYLTKSCAPLLEKEGLDFSQLEHAYLRIKGGEVPWEDKKFATPSGKIELYSEQAKKDGLSPLPSYYDPKPAPKELSLRLLTCHAKESMHSQGFAFTKEIPEVFINQETADTLCLKDKALVFIKGRNAKIKAMLKIDEAICDNSAFIYQGYWHKSGAVNFLTDSNISDMGKQAAFYDSFCTLIPC